MSLSFLLRALTLAPPEAIEKLHLTIALGIGPFGEDLTPATLATAQDQLHKLAILDQTDDMLANGRTTELTTSLLPWLDLAEAGVGNPSSPDWPGWPQWPPSRPTEASITATYR